MIDSRFYQRLRNVRQLGFGDLAFPGATHTRHAHSLGAMSVASRLFDAVAARTELSGAAREKFRAAVRMAVLCHDLGHMPLSHASEKIAPARAKLSLPDWLDGKAAGQASHEDYTAKILLDSSLTPTLSTALSRVGLTAAQVASLVTGVDAPGEKAFVDQGRDWSPLLRGLVSGELDADRMDYLLRDSFFTGVNYGRYDFEWICSNLNAAERDGKVYLALSRAAAFAFEDFLLSRYHMFLSVYFHHTSVSFDHMLRRYYEEAPGEFEIPSDPEKFLFCDDVALHHVLRQSKNRWADRIVTRRGFKRVAEFTERDTAYDTAELLTALEDAKVEHFSVESRGVLSRYFEGGVGAKAVRRSGAPSAGSEQGPHGPSLFIVDVSTGRLTSVADYTPLYERYQDSVKLSRVYARPDQAEAARAVVAKVTRTHAHEP